MSKVDPSHGQDNISLINTSPSFVMDMEKAYDAHHLHQVVEPVHHHHPGTDGGGGESGAEYNQLAASLNRQNLAIFCQESYPGAPSLSALEPPMNPQIASQLDYARHENDSSLNSTLHLPIEPNYEHLPCNGNLIQINDRMGSFDSDENQSCKASQDIEYHPEPYKTDQTEFCKLSVPSLSNLLPCNTNPLITVTINPMEQDEVTFVPPLSPVMRPHHYHTKPSETNNSPSDKNHLSDAYRKLSIGSASSLEDEDRLGPDNLDIRRVSDISCIHQLREISGMKHLASEFYEVTKTDDPDNLSLDSIHVRVLERCANIYQAPQKSSLGSKLFVVITTGLTALGIFYSIWIKNFGSGTQLIDFTKELDNY